MHFIVLLAAWSTLEQGDLGATAPKLDSQAGTTLPTNLSPPAWKTSPITQRLGRSKLEVMGAASAPHPQGRDLDPAWAGSCLGSSKHHPRLEASAV